MSVNSPVYGVGSGYIQMTPPPVVATRAPLASDIGYEIGTIWIFNSTTAAASISYILCGYFAGVPAWNQTSNAGGSGTFSSLTVTPGPTSITGSFTLIAGTNAVSFGADAADHAMAIGSSTGSSALTVLAGSGASSITTAGGSLAINSGVGAISISSDASATALNIGTGAAVVKTIAIGGTGANVITIGNAQTAGSVAIGTAMTGGTISIGGTGLQTGNFDLAPGTGAQAVTLANGGTGVKTLSIATGAVANVVTIGSTTASAQLILQAGSGATGLKLNAAGNVQMVPATVSDATGTAVLNSRVGVVTYTGFTTAAAGSQVFTVTNSVVSATSAIICTLANVGANDAQMTIQRVLPAAGSFSVTAKNNGAAALNGNVLLTFWVIA